MNGDSVTVDKCDKLRAQDTLEHERRTRDFFNAFMCEVKADIKELQKTVETGQERLMKRMDAKYDKLLYVILGWILTTAFLLYKS